MLDFCHSLCHITDMNKTLVKFIKEIGDEKASTLFEIKPRTARSLRLGERHPSPKLANLIVKKTKRHKHGPVTFEGIYRIKL